MSAEYIRSSPGEIDFSCCSSDKTVDLLGKCTLNRVLRILSEVRNEMISQRIIMCAKRVDRVYMTKFDTLFFGIKETFKSGFHIKFHFLTATVLLYDSPNTNLINAPTLSPELDETTFQI